jgi:bis(5'-adenosyl)-triphosphatase
MIIRHAVTVCPFCDNAVQSAVFLTRGDFMAIYNIAPVLPGHSLIIPKRHITSILDLQDKELPAFFDTARIALRILMKAFKTDSFDWSIQEKPEAGQTIEHLHLHIVPRLKGDLKYPGDWYPLIQYNDDAVIDSESRSRLKAADMQKIVGELKRIANNLE